jgi:hypothetical protein
MIRNIKLLFSAFGIFAASFISAQTVTHTIIEVQGELFSSPLIEQIVTVQGVVTATSEFGYFIQDGDGAWNGVFVYDNTNLPSVGDHIVVQGEVAEYFDNTELLNITYFEVGTSGNDLPSAAQLGTGFIGVTGEPYEGCLVRIYNAECTTPDADYGQGYFNDGTGDCMVDDLIYAPDPAWVLGEYYTITGALNYSFEEYKIEPRTSSDVSIGMYTEFIELTKLSLFPNPTTDFVTFNLNQDAVVNIYDNNGRLVVVENLQAGEVVLNVSNYYPGTYRIDCVSGTSISRTSFIVLK